MDIQGSIGIDLTKYGSEGSIIVSPLTFRMKTRLANALYELDERGTQHVRKGLAPGDVAVITILAHISEAPFKVDLCNLDSFYDFADTIDSVRIGSMDKLWVEITSAVDRIEDGSSHPLQESEDCPTTSSE